MAVPKSIKQFIFRNDAVAVFEEVNEDLKRPVSEVHRFTGLSQKAFLRF